MEIETRLPGLFNVQNALAAIAAARSLGVGLDVARDALADADRVPGRFEPVDEGQPFTVLVDYAHTPEALDNVLRAARELTEGRVHVVFGAGGDRDRAKRPLMGKAAAALADRVVVTSDNPRSEDPRGDHRRDPRRAPGRTSSASPTAAARSRWRSRPPTPGDVVVVAGKGHEQGQEFENGRKEPFDDVTVVREALR